MTTTESPVLQFEHIAVTDARTGDRVRIARVANPIAHEADDWNWRVHTVNHVERLGRDAIMLHVDRPEWMLRAGYPPFILLVLDYVSAGLLRVTNDDATKGDHA